MKRLAFLILVGIAVVMTIVLISTASGSVQLGISYKGQLVHEDESAFTEDKYGISFAIYKSKTGGEPIWAETQPVEVNLLGEFTVYLGPIDGALFEADPADPNDTGERFLQVESEGAVAMERALIVTLPYPLSTEVAPANKVSTDAAKKIWDPDDSLVDTMAISFANGSYEMFNTNQITRMKKKITDLESAVGRLDKEMKLIQSKLDSIAR